MKNGDVISNKVNNVKIGKIHDATFQLSKIHTYSEHLSDLTMLNKLNPINLKKLSLNHHEIDPSQLYFDKNDYVSKNIFENVHALTLIQCNKITNFSLFKNVHTLKLNNCDKIINISSLFNIKILELYCCNQIINISSLANLNILSLSYCANLQNVNTLCNIDKLKIYGFNKITNIY